MNTTEKKTQIPKSVRQQTEVRNQRRRRRRKRRSRLVMLVLLFVVIVFLTAGGVVFGGGLLGKTQPDDTLEAEPEVPLTTQPNENDSAVVTYRAELQRVSDEQKEQERQEIYAQRKSRWNLLLVNPDNTLPEDYEPDIVYLESGIPISSRVAEPLQAMLDAGQAAGYPLTITSGYRGNDEQQSLYEQQVQRQIGWGKTYEQALEDAKHYVAYPGTSEHATGYAADILSYDYLASSDGLLRQDYEYTDSAAWLREHCTEYGFILRYPEESIDITNVIYEPWHFRYVGKTAAERIAEAGITLEEYLGEYRSDNYDPLNGN